MSDGATDKKKKGELGALSPMIRRYLRPQLWFMVPAMLWGVVAAAAAFAVPFMVSFVFPIVFGEQELPPQILEWVLQYVQPEDLHRVKLWGAVLLIPIVMVLRGFATYLNSVLLTMAGMRMLCNMWVDMFARVQRLSFSFFDRHKRGEIMTTIMQYTQQLQSQMVVVLNDLVIQPLTLLAAIGYLIYAALTSNESAMLLANLLISALVIPLVRFVGKAIVKKMRLALTGMRVITSTVEETFTAQREVRAFNLEERQATLLEYYINTFNSLMLRIAAWTGALAPAIEIVSALALAYSLNKGCGDGLTLEQFAAIATAFYFCYDPIKRMGAIANQLRLMSVMANGINSVLLAKDETPEPDAPLPLPSPVAGVVDFDHVDFAYDKKTVLKDVHVHVPAGQIVALVGPSGSGKTTFINLICRFYDVKKGSVSIDGVDVRHLSREDRTGAIGLVSQFSALFNDTILENIRVGRPSASDAEVVKAGDSARVTEFAEARPDGYAYELAERGGGLSGGQRQRVSIARAFLKNAPILILDEATSALDMKSEALIQAALEELAEGHTTFIIAHRFSTIRMAQRILVFDEGRIIADGTHASLYESCALYRRLYDEQVKQAADIQGKEVPA